MEVISCFVSVSHCCCIFCFSCCSPTAGEVQVDSSKRLLLKKTGKEDEEYSFVRSPAPKSLTLTSCFSERFPFSAVAGSIVSLLGLHLHLEPEASTSRPPRRTCQAHPLRWVAYAIWLSQRCCLPDSPSHAERRGKLKPSIRSAVSEPSIAHTERQCVDAIAIERYSAVTVTS